MDVFYTHVHTCTVVRITRLRDAGWIVGFDFDNARLLAIVQTFSAVRELRAIRFGHNAEGRADVNIPMRFPPLPLWQADFTRANAESGSSTPVSSGRSNSITPRSTQGASSADMEWKVNRDGSVPAREADLRLEDNVFRPARYWYWSTLTLDLESNLLCMVGRFNKKDPSLKVVFIQNYPSTLFSESPSKPQSTSSAEQHGSQLSNRDSDNRSAVPPEWPTPTPQRMWNGDSFALSLQGVQASYRARDKHRPLLSLCPWGVLWIGHGPVLFSFTHTNPPVRAVLLSLPRKAPLGAVSTTEGEAGARLAALAAAQAQREARLWEQGFSLPDMAVLTRTGAYAMLTASEDPRRTWGSLGPGFSSLSSLKASSSPSSSATSGNGFDKGIETPTDGTATPGRISGASIIHAWDLGLSAWAAIDAGTVVQAIENRPTG